jgi:dihydroneopterin aldolase/2-amino-4-hydroxy-6-hydroxymethyldihydropteridine diphosphokinase
LDRIHIKGLRVMSVIGVLAHERESAQPLQLDLSVHVDLRDAGLSDELSDTANYGLLSERVATVARESKDLLLERLAHRIAEEALTFDRVEAVDVTVTKLRPPIAEDVDATAISIHRTRQDQEAFGEHDVIVALGSNLGDRVGYLRQAIGQLGDVVRTSQVFETAPIGGPGEQDAFLNMVVAVRTSLDPFAMLRRCQRIEASANRQRAVHWGPRTLDVDILFYDDAVIDSTELTVPHPRWQERRFVLAPLAEVAPERVPPGWEQELPPAPVQAVGRLDQL